MTPRQRAVLRVNMAHGLLCGGRLEEAARRPSLLSLTAASSNAQLREQVLRTDPALTPSAMLP